MWHQAAQGTQAVWCKKQKTKHKCRNKKQIQKKLHRSLTARCLTDTQTVRCKIRRRNVHIKWTHTYESATVEKGKKWIQNFEDYKMILQICQSRNTPPKTKCRNCLTGDWWSGEGVGDKNMQMDGVCKYYKCLRSKSANVQSKTWHWDQLVKHRSGGERGHCKSGGKVKCGLVL